MRIAVTGGGGFISSHLIKRLLDDGHEVKAIDIKPLEQWEQVFDIQNIDNCDLMNPYNSEYVLNKTIDQVMHLACPMGGIAHITKNKFTCARSAKMTTNMLEASIKNEIDRFFLSSSACAYADRFQTDPNVISLDESMAWPAAPERGYGLSKLYEEELCDYARTDFGLETRVARFHNIFGTHTAWIGGKEKAPAAVSRKVAEARLGKIDSIEIWGDGEQTRSFCWVDDCVEGILKLTNGDYHKPVNIGSSELITIEDLYLMVEDIAGISIPHTYDLSAPQGVRGRNSNNDLVRELFNWEPSTKLRDGMEVLYAWVYDQVSANI